MMTSSPTDGLISIEKALLIDLLLGGALGSAWCGDAVDSGKGDVPDLVLLRGDRLATLQHLAATGDRTSRAAVQALAQSVDRLLDMPTLSVVHKGATPPSEDKHDYFSVSTSGANVGESSWVPRDGQADPDLCADSYDARRLMVFAERVLNLAIAAYLTGDKKYSAKAADLVRCWFLDPKTRQSPHFEYAQVTQGQGSSGQGSKGQGLFEARQLVYVTEALRILEHCGALTPSEYVELRRWFSMLLDWMRNSDQGKHAANSRNNIGIWFGLQCIAYALFCNQPAKAKEVITSTSLGRILDQIETDGTLPEELSRSCPSDIAFTMAVMAQISRSIKRLGISMWDSEKAEGKALQLAQDWLLTNFAAARAQAESEPTNSDENLRRLEAGAHAEKTSGQEVTLSEAEQARQLLQQDPNEATASPESAKERLELAEAAQARLDMELAEIYASRSWKFTAPLRTATRLATQFRDANSLRQRKVVCGLRSLMEKAGSRGGKWLKENSIRRGARVLKLKGEYKRRKLDLEPDTFVLSRVIGNDLYPRHKKGQSRENLKFILDNEPALENCSKRWVVNRIIDEQEEAAVIALLRERGQDYEHIPFDKDAYRRVPWDFECFPHGFFLRGDYAELEDYPRSRAEVRVCRLKNNYVMNNNGARNAALRDGRRRAKWVLPWDGNCFVTEAGWSGLMKAVREAPYLKYFAVPMARVTDNRQLLQPGFSPEAAEEPQIVFRRDAKEEFDEAVPYGRRPKVELLWRLGVPGDWDRWYDDAWDLPRAEPSAEAHQFAQAGWVARLASGRPDLETASKSSLIGRGQARVEAIIATLGHADELALQACIDPPRLTVYDEAAIVALGRAVEGTAEALLLERLKAEADVALARGPYSVVDKTTLPPSGDRHDYWHPAPYWWPNPETRDGLPFVRRDGDRVPGTQLFEPDSQKYDRTRLQRLFDDTTILALAWKAIGETRYAEHGAKLVRRWFVEPDGRMNPHLRYAQVRRGHDNDEGQSFGVIEMKDLYFFLDAVRLLTQAAAFDETDQKALSNWLREYLNWLEASPQGMKERRAKNNHGTCYDLQVSCIAAYLGDAKLLLSTLRDSQERMLEHFAPDGSQPAELKRTQTAHYVCFNLQSWINLALLAERCGQNLWDFSARDGRGICRAFEWLVPFISGAEWRWPQTDPFDVDRYWPLFYACTDHYTTLRRMYEKIPPSRLSVKPVYFPHDGIKPFWMLDKPPQKEMGIGRPNGCRHPMNRG